MTPEEVAKWLGLIELSRLEKKRKQPDWHKFKQYYLGCQWEEHKAGDGDVITINMVYAQIKVTIPSIYARNPKVYFIPRRPSAVDKVKVAEVVINQDLDIMDFKSEMKKVILDVLLFGTGFMKTTYFMDEEEEEEVLDSSDAELNSAIAQFRGQAPLLTPLSIGKNGTRVIRVSPDDLNWTPGMSDLNESGFISHHVRKRLEVVKGDNYYSNTKDLHATAIIDEESRKGFTNWNESLEGAVAMVDLFEIWDLDRGKLFVLALGHNKPLVDPYDHPYPYPHPFDRVVFSPIPDEILGMAEVSQGIPQQDEYNKMRTYQMSHVKRFGRKYLAKKGVIQDEEQWQRLEDGEDGVIVEVSDENPVGAVAPLQDAPLPNDFYAYTASIKDDWVETVGITPYKRGLLRGAKTATEASIAEENSDVRDDERTDLIADMVRKIVKKMVLARKEFTPTQEITLITEDIVAGPVWEKWSKETFDLEADVEIEYGSSLPHNERTRIELANAFYDRMIVNPTVHPQAMAVKLAEAYGIRDYTEIFLPPEIINQQIINNALFSKPQQKGVSATGGTPPQAGGESKPGEEQARQLGASQGGSNGNLRLQQGNKTA